MTDERTDRIDRLRAAAQERSRTKTQAAETAIKRLVKAGGPVNFRSVAEAAGVSHTFLYRHPELRPRIERLRMDGRAQPPRAAATDDNIVTALHARIKRITVEHRREVETLRRELEAAHGENLELRRRGQGIPAAATGSHQARAEHP